MDECSPRQTFTIVNAVGYDAIDEKPRRGRLGTPRERRVETPGFKQCANDLNGEWRACGQHQKRSMYTKVGRPELRMYWAGDSWWVSDSSKWVSEQEGTKFGSARLKADLETPDLQQPGRDCWEVSDGTEVGDDSCYHKQEKVCAMVAIDMHVTLW